MNCGQNRYKKWKPEETWMLTCKWRLRFLSPWFFNHEPISYNQPRFETLAHSHPFQRQKNSRGFLCWASYFQVLNTFQIPIPVQLIGSNGNDVCYKKIFWIKIRFRGYYGCLRSALVFSKFGDILGYSFKLLIWYKQWVMLIS